MIKSKYVKALALGMGLTVFSTGMAMADTGNGNSAVVQSNQQGISQDLLQKQREIDNYVFEEHAQEIADQGFTVTHTGPMDDVVEVGITPYSAEHADYLYEIFGKEKVRVVEGQQAVTLGVEAGSDNEAELYTTTSVAAVEASAAQASPNSNAMAMAAGAAVILGGVVIGKLRLAKK